MAGGVEFGTTRVTEVERLTIRPGDRIIVHVDRFGSFGPEEKIGERLAGEVRRALQLPEDVVVAVVGPGIRVTVTGEEPSDDHHR